MSQTKLFYILLAVYIGKVALVATTTGLLVWILVFEGLR